jgi:hypothetical protein
LASAAWVVVSMIVMYAAVFPVWIILELHQHV